MLAKLDMVAVLAAKDIFEYIMQPFPTGLGALYFIFEMAVVNKLHSF